MRIHMEPARHYLMAESCIQQSLDPMLDFEERTVWLARGKIHALLALVDIDQHRRVAAYLATVGDEEEEIEVYLR